MRRRADYWRQCDGARQLLGTITNVDGRYTLANVPESSTITVSYIGYITVNYAATSRNLSQVVLREDSKTLEEVVVVGYGTQKKVNLTGAVAIVSGDELTTRSGILSWSVCLFLC